MTIEDARVALCARLRRRREEIEAVIAIRIYAVANPAEANHPEYVQGLRTSLTAATDYGLALIESGDRVLPSLPPSLVNQARSAARHKVGLDTVLRRYVAGHTLLIEYAIAEAEVSDLLSEISWAKLLRGQSTLFDQLISEVSDAYMQEASASLESVEQQRAEQIRELLNGEPVDISDLSYEFDAWHVGAIASGPGAVSAIRHLANSFDLRLLFVNPDPETVWAWFGSPGPQNVTELEWFGRSALAPQPLVALGEPAEGPAGWRLTHRQSYVALSIALRGACSPVRYADVALLASMLNDDLLVTSLRKLYLAPLEQERDDGRVLFETLRTYFAVDRNISSAAAALGVTRRTVSNRLRTVEARLGSPLRSVAAEMEAALRLQDIQVRTGNG